MEKYVIIDNKMRDIEKDYLRKLGYNLIELKTSNSVYEEISSHVDIFACKIKDKIIFENNVYNELVNKKYKFLDNKIICGKCNVGCKYPFDVLYNVCSIGKNVIHNFKYTDKEVINVIQKEKLNMININQGYSNCSIAVIDENSAIVTDKKIAQKLIQNNIDVLLVEEKLDIKLLKNDNTYSKMNGFIGGCMSKIENKIIVFGELLKIDKDEKIKNFIQSKNLDIIDFKGMDVIDYGGILLI